MKQTWDGWTDSLTGLLHIVCWISYSRHLPSRSASVTVTTCTASNSLVFSFCCRNLHTWTFRSEMIYVLLLKTKIYHTVNCRQLTINLANYIIGITSTVNVIIHVIVAHYDCVADKIIAMKRTINKFCPQYLWYPYLCFLGGEVDMNIGLENTVKWGNLPVRLLKLNFDSEGTNWEILIGSSTNIFVLVLNMSVRFSMVITLLQIQFLYVSFWFLLKLN
jgi:hypothetical protein